MLTAVLTLLLGVIVTLAIIAAGMSGEPYSPFDPSRRAK